MGTILDVDFKLVDEIDNFKREEARPANIEAINSLIEEVESSYQPLEKQKQEFAEYVVKKDIMTEVMRAEAVNDEKSKKAKSLIGRILKALNL
jgi:chromosome segregation ATPase